MSPHGTKARYDRGRCRCADCREANTAYMRQYRTRKATPATGNAAAQRRYRARHGRYKRFCVACQTWFRTNDRMAVRCAEHPEESPDA